METSKCPKCGRKQEYHGTCRVNPDGSEVKMTVWHCGSRQIVEVTGEVDWRDGTECKGLAFKAYTHERMDNLGAPHTVEDSEHTKAGCRIGGRFDWVEAELARLKSEKEAAEKEVERLRLGISGLCGQCGGIRELERVKGENERLHDMAVWGVLWESAFDSTWKQDHYFNVASELEHWIGAHPRRREVEDLLLCEAVTLISNNGVHLLVKCSDTFHYATADAESIEPEEFQDLRNAITEAGATWGPILWCARKRKMRPLKPHYIKMTDAQRALFDACGPERNI